MGLIQWIIIIILVAIIIFGFSAVFDFGKGVFKKVYPYDDNLLYENVTRIIDGDTLVLETGKHIRLALVNTPERGEYGYEPAREWLEYRCLGKMALVDLDDGQLKGSYDRLVGFVWCGDNFVNQEIVDLRVGVVVKQYCAQSEFRFSSLCL